MKLLDCTLRDGGYYCNWDFKEAITDDYFLAFNNLPVEYLEIGYRSPVMKEYHGQYFYCPEYMVEAIRSKSNKKLVIILNEKDVKRETARRLLAPCLGKIDMVRLAIDPENLKRALGLAEEVKQMGFEVGFNVMYMSSWKQQKNFLPLIKEVDGLADYFYMVDSYGGVYPKDVIETIELVRMQTNVKLGFHGHNNLELGLINTLTAIENGVDIVDATITGMGRGAGNLKMELLLTVLNATGKCDLDFNALSKAVDPFTRLQEQYGWGTNLPYMVSGANSLPQKHVMEWVSKRYFSFNSIIRALTNQSKGVLDNENLPTLENISSKPTLSALIVGGGPGVIEHATALQKFVSQNPDLILIHASAKNAKIFRSIPNLQYYCLVGNEGHRLESVFGDVSTVAGKTILPPYPRTMGTYIPEALKTKAFQLAGVDFTPDLKDSHTALALQTALTLGVQTLFVAGYDGYTGELIGQREQELFRENELLFSRIKTHISPCLSLTPTQYSELLQDSVYAKL